MTRLCAADPPPRGYSIPLIDLASETNRQVIVDREPGQYLGHPTTVLLEDHRTMLAVYPKGHGRGAIILKRSRDRGLTWSERLPLPENWATSLETPTLHRVVDAQAKKRLIVFSGLYPVRMAVSDDDGATWSPLRPVGDWGGIVAMASVETLLTGPGHYLAMFHDDGRFFRKAPAVENPVVFTLWQTRSVDGGLTWAEPEAVFKSSEVHLCEPGIIRSPDGRVLAALLRENARKKNSHFIVSNDEGRTWSAPKELPGALTGDRHVGKYAPDGRLFISFRDTTLESPTRGDWIGWVGRFHDILNGGEGQYRVRLMKNHEGADCAYPGVEVLSDGTFVATTYGHWTAGEEPYVVSVRFRLAELDERAPPRSEPAGSGDSGQGLAPLNWTTQQDHKNMMQQLGITRLRPGPSGQPGAPNSANYDPAKANPFPDLPEVLTLKNGQQVTTPEMWWKQRRPEIVEDFEREVIGRVPKNVPQVKWTVVSNVTDGLVGSFAAVGKQLVGQVDNSACPGISVNIRMTVVTPAQAQRPVPVLMMFGGFGGGGMPRPAGTPAPTNRAPAFGGPFKDPPSTEQLLAAGWGYASINPGSIQADNGAGLTKGIIGLVNLGRPRQPDDWGALRAWAWGAARGLDYLETDPAVDARKVGIEGVSRYGKAALVAMAFEPRFAVALVGSSGEGGAKLHRRHFGEAVENLTGSGEYHWMAGNFLKYGAAESTFGSKNAGDLPVDAHMLIALCAPRLTFISYGVPEGGDALWLDQPGSYMATVAAGSVFRLLGARDVGVQEDYRTAMMPPVNTGLLDGELAWRQHDGGHEDRSNMKHFIAWANRFLGHVPPAAPAAEQP